jgi:hypothetical protein
VVARDRAKQANNQALELIGEDPPTAAELYLPYPVRPETLAPSAYINPGQSANKVYLPSRGDIRARNGPGNAFPVVLNSAVSLVRIAQFLFCLRRDHALIPRTSNGLQLF